MGIEYIDKRHARLVVSSGTGSLRVRRVKRITYSGKRDAEKQYREFLNEVENERGVDRNLTVSSLVTQYIDQFERNGGKATTVRAYRTSAKPIMQYFEGYKACEVVLYSIDSFVASEAKIRAPKTIKNEVSLLKSAYRYAIRRGLLKVNPCDYATIPRQVKPDINILSDSDMPRFLDALADMPLDFKVMCELALFCGLRRSEILGLQKDDIGETITINKVRHHFHNRDIIETPKTVTSNRTLAVPPFILSDIALLLEDQQDRYGQSDYLILTQFGEPVSSTWCDRKMHKLVTDHDLPRVTMHGLRHTYASMLIKAGVPISEVSAQLGHSSVDITLRIYTHLFTEASTASRAISELINDTMAPKWHQTKKESPQPIEVASS